MPTTYAITNGSQYMNANIWTGNGATQTIVNTAGFQPDLVWYKSRSNSGYDQYWEDSVRGTNKWVGSSSTSAEVTVANSLTSFNSNGFTLGSDAGGNQNTLTYVGWQWKAGANTTVSNTSGSITSTVSANVTAGFSIVTWTAGSSGGATIGHGLGVTPAMIIVKQRSGVSDWWVWHQSLSNPAQSFLQLNNTTAVGGNTNAWNNTAPTSSVFSQVNNYIISAGGTAVAYCWAEIAGFSKFGSYTGNGNADGPFVYTGFRPKFVMYKNITTAGNGWVVLDSTRSPYNLAVYRLVINTSDAEYSSVGYNNLDFLSNGFKVRSNSTDQNNNGDTYIYMTFAENPFKYANAR